MEPVEAAWVALEGFLVETVELVRKSSLSKRYVDHHVVGPRSVVGCPGMPRLTVEPVELVELELTLMGGAGAK